jgi:hypothetical protein
MPREKEEKRKNEAGDQSGTREEKNKERTDEGYDEAAHSGESRYGVPSGAGGVFGTTGGGTDPRGLHVVERPVTSAEGELPDIDAVRGDREVPDDEER